MDALKNMKGHEFRKFILKLASENAADFGGSLEEYLRALLAVIDDKQNEESFGYAFIAKLLLDTFSQEPLLFDPKWHKYTEPPDTMYGVEMSMVDAWQIAKEMLMYQISDLRLMRERGDFDLGLDVLYYGKTSPNGNRWYNFEVGLFLRCGLGEMKDDEDLSIADWRDLADFLFFAHAYE